MEAVVMKRQAGKTRHFLDTIREDKETALVVINNHRADYLKSVYPTLEDQIISYSDLRSLSKLAKFPYRTKFLLDDLDVYLQHEFPGTNIQAVSMTADSLLFNMDQLGEERVQLEKKRDEVRRATT